MFIYRDLLCVIVFMSFFFSQNVRGEKTDSVISTTDSPVSWRIETKNSTYQLAVAEDGIVIPLYYGPNAELYHKLETFVRADEKVGSKIREVPYRGGFVEQTPALEVVFADGTRDCELIYADYDIINSGEHSCLRIKMVDTEYGLVVWSYIRVIADHDILEKWLEIKNDSKDVIRIENAQSGSVWLDANEYELSHYSGDWSREFLVHQTLLTPGIKTLAVRDFKSWAAPWFAVRTKLRQGTAYSVWFGEVAYAGNWRIDFEQNCYGHLQIIGGINFWDSHISLNPGKTFTTPKMIFGSCQEGRDGAAQRLHAYTRQEVLRKEKRHQLRPVLYNSWFATEFNINLQQQLELAKIARDIGVELFVIDDGWFQGRNNDKAGLGDWRPDENKFPQGLQPLIEAVNDLGMDFGIWIEPEMVNADSDLYRAHPEWVLHYSSRTAHEHRNQLMLNLAREDVCKYLLETFTDLFKKNDIKFVKWDMNRQISEPGWSDAPKDKQREVRIRYVENLMQLIDTLQQEFPDILFETCCGGGARINLQILSRMDQGWPSDNTCPVDRVMMQYGYLNAFPANTMVNWVTDVDWHREQPSLDYRFDVSMCGVLGVGADITKWSPEERKMAARKITQYKTIRPIVQGGIAYRLVNPFKEPRAMIEYVLTDRSQAVVFLYNMWDTLYGSNDTAIKKRSIPLKGLDPGAIYMLQGDYEGTFTGESLMNRGLPWFVYGDSNSGIVILKKIGG